MKGYPITVAGPFRSCTGFPILPLRGTAQYSVSDAKLTRGPGPVNRAAGELPKKGRDGNILGGWPGWFVRRDSFEGRRLRRQRR